MNTIYNACLIWFSTPNSTNNDYSEDLVVSKNNSFKIFPRKRNSEEVSLFKESYDEWLANFEKRVFLEKIINKSQYILDLKEEYWFNWSFIPITQNTWHNVIFEIKAIFDKLDFDKIKTDNILFSIKPWNSWNIDFYIRKEWITTLVNFSEQIKQSTYSISYKSDWIIESHYWDYNRSVFVFDIYKFYFACIQKQKL